jgi:SAM-dependent methyltransferase
MEPRIDYNAISRVYDQVRQADVELIQRLLQEIDGLASAQVLDIGCGTGNYAYALQQLSHAQVVGVDPSPGMLAQARQKNSQVSFRVGDAGHLPCDEDTFDLVYMTDVIHHVPDIDRLFVEVRRVLKPGGKLCVVTQSHAQIAARPIARFFPATVAIDQARYPDIPAIVAAASEQGLACLATEISGAVEDALDHRYLDLVRAKGYSMLHLIDDAAYAAGLARLEATLAQGDLVVRRAGQTLVWLEK